MRIEALCERLLASVGLAFFSAPVLAGHPDRPFKRINPYAAGAGGVGRGSVGRTN